MNPDCNQLNPLQRGGANQTIRLVKSLHPSHVLVDERGLDEYLVYAQKYAQLLRYYSIENQEQGDWKAFIESDISVLIAHISTTNLNAYRNAFQEASNFKELFPPILELIRLADTWYHKSIPGLALQVYLSKIINSILNDALRNVLSYGLKAIDIGLALPSNFFTFNDLRSDLWSLDNIHPDAGVFPSRDSSITEEIADARNRMQIEFQAIFDNLQRVINLAPEFLEETIEKFPQHEPHIALFIAFLKLFNIARDHLNTITRRHLNFYYQEVLGLEAKPAQVDDVHVVFELAKGFDEFLIQAGTQLNAGKDLNKANVFYLTNTDLLVNKTSIDPTHGLKNLWIEKDYGNKNFYGVPLDYTISNIYASPVANSSDGLGAELEDPEGKWPSLGQKKMPYAEIGFAVASPILLLGDGNRTVSFIFTFDKPLALNYSSKIEGEQTNALEAELKQNIIVDFSSEKGWSPVVDIETVKIEINNGKPTGKIILQIQLPAQEVPVVPYNPAVFTEKINTKYPLFRFRLDNEGLIPVNQDNHLITRLGSIKKEAKQYRAQDEYTYGDIVQHEGNWFIYKNLKEKTSKAPSSDQDNVFWSALRKSYAYKYFKLLSLSKLCITVNVVGVKNLILENDLGAINPTKPFLPFGFAPKEGSNFFIGSYEVFQKQLKTLKLHVTWINLPTVNFKTHYANYQGGDIPGDNSEFKVKPQLLRAGVWEPNDPKDVTLFNKSTKYDAPTPIAPIEIKEILTSEHNLNPQTFESLSPDLRQGFVRLVLQKNFLHQNYGPSLANAVTHKTAVPNEPYTPTFASCSLEYKSSVALDQNVNFKNRMTQLFHIGPFGWQEFFPFTNGLDPQEAIFSRKLVPEFLITDQNDSSATPVQADAEGTLYLGLKDLQGGQSLSILFQMAEGSANPDKNKPDVVWSYWSNNVWIDFASNEILSDSTNGLLTSGIITFVLPKKMSNNTRMLPTGLHWIKASVIRDSDGICQTIAVLPQAVKASFQIEPNSDLDRLKVALPAETINKLLERQAAIKKVAQPFSSFKGKVKEQVEAPLGILESERFNKEYNEFFIRVSERLRHKNRGIAIFDYERLVLQQFPDVYKVKCLNHTCIGYDAQHPEFGKLSASEHAPGFVKLIVVPNLRNHNAVNPFEPKVSLNQLEEIKAFLRPLLSDFVTLEVKNPTFEEIKVEFKVRFFPLQEANRGFFEKLLNQEIIQFLSPWLYEEGKDLQVGGKIHRSHIINFIEEREYVDFLTDFKMDHLVSSSIRYLDIEEAIASTSSSVLVSAAAHTIRGNL